MAVPKRWLSLNLAIVVRMFERVLITGANGHLGRRLIARLRGNCDVVAVVQVRSRGGDAGETVAWKFGWSTIVIGEALEAAAVGCEAAVHLAGIIKETAGNRYVDAHEGTARALTGLDGIRHVVYLSVVGAARDSPNACLASKAAAESLLLSGGARTRVLRVPMVLGEGDYASLALGRRASAPVSFTFRAGSFEQPVYAGDVVDAIVALLERADAPELIELAGPERVTRRELTRRAGAILGRRTRLISLPIASGRMLAAMFEGLSANPPVTRAMLDVLDHDDDVDLAPACRSLGLELTPLDETLRRCLRSP